MNPILIKLRTAIGAVIATLMSITLLASLSPRLAHADTTTCTGLLTGAHDNVVVPSGADCILLGAQVTGNVRVESAASLHAISLGPVSTTIGGNVHGIHSRFVLLQFQTQVGGNLHIHGGDAGTTSGFDILTSIGGNAQIELNAGKTFVDAAIVGGQLHIMRNSGCIEAEFNTVGGNVRVEDNIIPLVSVCPLGNVPGGMSVTGNMVSGNLMVLRNTGDGVKQVAGNTVAKKLTCRDNDPTFVGGPNPTSPTTEGQCF